MPNAPSALFGEAVGLSLGLAVREFLEVPVGACQSLRPLTFALGRDCRYDLSCLRRDGEIVKSLVLLFYQFRNRAEGCTRYT